MKIIYVENVRIPSERAHAYQIVQACAGLAHLHHEVTLVNPDRAGKADVYSSYGIPDGLFRHVRLRSWDPLSTWPVAKALAYALQRWAFVRALRTWARTQTADVWYTRDPAMVDALQKVIPGPWVLELHDAPTADAGRWKRIRSLIRHYIVISKGLKDCLEREGISNENITVAQDGFDPEQFRAMPSRSDARRKWDIPEQAFLAVYAGGFYPWKGMDLALRAMDQLPDNVWFLLAGGPPADMERVLAEAPESLRSRIRALPYVDRKDIPALYAAADVGLLTTSPDHEIGKSYTSPLKQFEYLAAGLPVLASDVPSSHEVLTDEVARFYAPTERGFAEAFRSLQADEGWRSTASKIGPELVLPYSWQERARIIADCLGHYIAKMPNNS